MRPHQWIIFPGFSGFGVSVYGFRVSGSSSGFSEAVVVILQSTLDPFGPVLACFAAVQLQFQIMQVFWGTFDESEFKEVVLKEASNWTTPTNHWSTPVCPSRHIPYHTALTPWLPIVEHKGRALFLKPLQPTVRVLNSEYSQIWQPMRGAVAELHYSFKVAKLKFASIPRQHWFPELAGLWTVDQHFVVLILEEINNTHSRGSTHWMLPRSTTEISIRQALSLESSCDWTFQGYFMSQV